jgi:hypothetical protein
MSVALVSIGMLGVLVFGLGFAVSLARGRAEVVGAIPPDSANPLYKLHRAHANTTEYAPFLAVLFLVLGTRDPATWVLWCIGIVTLARYLLAAGLILSKSLDEPHPLRFVGAATTYLGGFALCGALFASL